MAADRCDDGLLVVPTGLGALRGARVALVGDFANRRAVVGVVRQAGGKYHDLVAGDEEAPDVIVVGARPRGKPAATHSSSEFDIEAMLLTKKHVKWCKEMAQVREWMKRHPSAMVVDESFREMDKRGRDRLLLVPPSPHVRERLAAKGEEEDDLPRLTSLHQRAIAAPPRPHDTSLSKAFRFTEVSNVGISTTVTRADVTQAYLLLYLGLNVRDVPSDLTEAALRQAVQPILTPRYNPRWRAREHYYPSDPTAKITRVMMRDQITAVAEDARAHGEKMREDTLTQVVMKSMWRNPVALMLVDLPDIMVVENDRDVLHLLLPGGSKIFYRWEFCTTKPRVHLPPPRPRTAGGASSMLHEGSSIGSGSFALLDSGYEREE